MLGKGKKMTEDLETQGTEEENNDVSDTHIIYSQTNDENDDSGEGEDIKAIARKLGWREDHDGSNRPYVNATDYILRSGEIQDTMRTQLKDYGSKIAELTDQLTNGIESFKQHQKSVFEAEKYRLEQEIKSLRAERRQAIKDGDSDLVDEYDEKIENIRKRQNSAPKIDVTQKKQTENTPSPEFVEWHRSNTWYKKDAAMTAFADQIARENAGIPMGSVLKIVDERIAEEFPHKFNNNNKTPNNSIDSSNKRPTKKDKSYSVRDLTYEQRKTMERFVNMGVLTAEQYIEDLVKNGTLGA